MTCEEAMTLLSAELDGELRPQEQEALEAHLADCAECSALRDSLAGLDRQVAALREEAPEGLKKGVLYRIDQATGKAKPSKARWFGPGTALGAVAALLVLLVGLKVIPLQPAGSNAAKQDMDAAVTAAPAETQAPAMEINALDTCGEPYTAAEQQVDGFVPSRSSGHASDSKDMEEPQAPDYYYLNGGTNSEGEPLPVTEALLAECEALSKAREGAVLLYTEFDYKSLLTLLETEEPALAKLLADLEPEEQGSLVLYETDCGTILALQEWLLENLPQSEVMDPAVREAETRLMVRMEALDPGSSNLRRVITWDRPVSAVSWPDAWPGGWAVRLRTEENWALCFPSTDFAPERGALAYLAFVQ